MVKHQFETPEWDTPLDVVRCTVCGQTWKKAPGSECPGVKVYGWGAWPEQLLTKKQLADAGYQTGKQLPPPAGVVKREKSPDGWMWLYDRAQGVAKKPMSDEARAKLKTAAQKSREGWYCCRCGRPHGHSTRRGWKAGYQEKYHYGF